MTAYLHAAIVCRVLAVLVVAATVWLVSAGHPWWAALTGWTAFLTVFLGGLCHRGHHRTLIARRTPTRRKETHPA